MNSISNQIKRIQSFKKHLQISKKSQKCTESCCKLSSIEIKKEFNKSIIAESELSKKKLNNSLVFKNRRY